MGLVVDILHMDGPDGWGLKRHDDKPLTELRPPGMFAWARKHLRYPTSGDVDKSHVTCMGGEFRASAKWLRRRIRTEYADITEELAVPNPEAAHYMERLMEIVFNRPNEIPDLRSAENDSTQHRKNGVNDARYVDEVGLTDTDKPYS